MQKVLTSLRVFFFSFLIFFAAVFVFSYLQALAESSGLANFNRDPQNYNSKLQVVAKNEKVIAQFKTAIANDDKKRAYGLMNLKDLPQDQAMLFIFDKEDIVVMWMKNTQIALDMLFINSDGIISNIKTNATPMSLEHIFSKKKVNQVLEINGGLVEKLGIQIGQKVIIKNENENF